MNASTTPQVTPTNKTATERQAQLSTILSRIDSGAAADMPADTKAVVDNIAGLEFKFGDVVIDKVPTAGEWKSYRSKAGALVYTALDTFQTRPLGTINGKRISVKVSVQVS